MANTGYGACEDINDTTRTAIENRQKANASPAGYLPWQTKRKPWIKAYSCATEGGAAVSNGLGDDGITKLSELYHSSNNRPLPGITGFTTTEEGTHGGFKEGKLAFVCWTKEDFATLSKSFLTYGMTITVEWGWSINQENGTVAKNGFAAKRCVDNDADLMKAVAAHQSNTAACYELMRGQITDFSWSMAANGSFEGECTLTSMAGNTAKSPIKIATKDCTCAEDKTEGKSEKGPTWNIMQILDQYIDQCSNDDQTVKYEGVVTGIGLTSNVDSEAEGAESSWIFWSKAAFNYITFEAFEELCVNLQIGSIVNDSGNKGTTRGQAKATVGQSIPSFVSSNQKFASLFYSNHSVLRPGVKEIASGDPRVCLLPGSKLQQETIDNFKKNDAYKSATSCFNGTEGIYLANILLNINMIKEEFDNCTANTGAGEFMKRVLSRVNEACGGIWNFSMVPYSKAENIIQWLDVDKGPETITTITIPAYGKDSVARGVSTQTESDPDFQAQIMYGANNKNGKGGGNKSGGVALWAGGVIDSYMDKMRVSSECTAADKKKEGCTTDANNKDIETMSAEEVIDVFQNLGSEVSSDSVASATRCVHTLAKGETADAITAEVRVIPVPISLDLELDGIGGFTFGNLLTINSLPNAYNNWYFQITKVEHKISNADWTTNLSCGMMRKI